jgi:thiol-disulfide isomerase/thioredoxin
MRLKNLAIGLAALAVAATIALYGIDWRQGNVSAEAACTDALQTAERLRPLAAGEVAAFQVARQAKDLGGLAFQAPDGAATTLAATSEGKLRLLNLWATWCAPCRKEMPALDRLEAEKGGEDFAVVPVSIDIGGPEKPAAFLASVAVERLPLYRDPTTDIFNDLKKEGLAVGLPVTALVDRQGCLLGHMNGPAEWDSEDAIRLIEAALAPVV